MIPFQHFVTRIYRRNRYQKRKFCASVSCGFEPDSDPFLLRQGVDE